MSLSQFSFSWAASAAQAATSYLYASNVKPCAAPVPAPASEKIAIQNVTIWDGNKTLSSTTLVIEGTKISSSKDTTGATIVNGNGGFLMPGLINTHFHAADDTALGTTANAGITTGFDLGSFPTSKMGQWREGGSRGLTSVRYSGAAACVGPGFPASQPGFPQESWINSTADARNYVETRVKEGVDFIKIFISEDPKTHDIEPKEDWQQEIKNTAANHGKVIISHAPSFDDQEVARHVGGKFITHIPIDRPLDKSGVRDMLGKKQVAIPTLIMMKRTAENRRLENLPVSYYHANASVALMYEMGVPILVGTDAAPEDEGGVVTWGVGIHEEMGLLVDAGMSNEDVLRGATSLTAEYFNLTDRGVIKPGMRADLLLLSHSPLDDIYNSDTVVQIWTAGTPVKK